MTSARFEGQVAIITGGASGIGRAIGQELARRGAKVVLADRQREQAEMAAEGIRGEGGEASAAELDVRDAAAFEALAAQTVEAHGRVDLLFNNAGIAVGGEMASYELADWDDVIDVNVRGVAYGIQAVYRRMIAAGSGHIVNTASVAGLLPATNEGSYGASKHAVVGMSRSLRIEAKRHGVKVSVLCPGAIRTPILTGGVFGRINIPGVGNEKILELWERARPMAVDAFARAALDAVAANEAVIVIPRWWKALWYLDRLSQAASTFFMERAANTLQQEIEASKATTPAVEPAVSTATADSAM